MKVWHKYSFPKKDHFVNPLLTVCAISHTSQFLPCYKPREGLLLLPHLLLLLLHVHHDHHLQVLGGRGDPLPLHLQPDPAPVQRHVCLGRDGQFLFHHSTISFLSLSLVSDLPFLLLSRTKVDLDHLFPQVNHTLADWETLEEWEAST